jgi:hypothetical protein
MALRRCARCGGLVALHGSACTHCGQQANARATAPRGVVVEQSDSLSQLVRRLCITLLILIVGVTWFAAASYARAHHPLESADEKAIQCDLIEEQGEDYFGELADCRNRLAYLRLMERR